MLLFVIFISIRLMTNKLPPNLIFQIKTSPLPLHLAKPAPLQREAHFGPNYSLRCKTDDTTNIAFERQVSSLCLIQTHLRSFLFDLSQLKVEMIAKHIYIT